jgi:hypothetical protein
LLEVWRLLNKEFSVSVTVISAKIALMFIVEACQSNWNLTS